MRSKYTDMCKGYGRLDSTNAQQQVDRNVMPCDKNAPPTERGRHKIQRIKFQVKIQLNTLLNKLLNRYINILERNNRQNDILLEAKDLTMDGFFARPRRFSSPKCSQYIAPPLPSLPHHAKAPHRAPLSLDFIGIFGAREPAPWRPYLFSLDRRKNWWKCENFSLKQLVSVRLWDIQALRMHSIRYLKT